ncbi:MAG: DMT family transporter [Rhodothermaceae bacterium]|nr:DMT family transporter [Rhodothermaceae bacterium]
MPARAPLRVWVVLAAGLLAISFSPILVRYASAAPGQALAVWRTVFAAVLLMPIAWGKARHEIRALTRRARVLIGLAGVMLGLHFIAWIESLYYTSVASASVLVTTSPLFIAVLGFVVLRERLTVRTMGAIGGAVVGAALIGLADAGDGVFPQAALGNGLALAGALLVAVYLLIGRAVRQHTNFLAYLFPLYATAALTTLVAALVRGVPLAQPWPILGLCLLMAVGPQLLGHGSFNYAVRYLPAALLGLLSLIEPIGASLLAFGLFGEVPRPLALVGMAIVLGAIALAFVRRRSGPPGDR